MPERSPLPPQPVDLLPVHVHRRPLNRSLRALAEGRLTVGFLGGSITEENACCSNWPAALARWIAGVFPGLSLTVENAAIGATGSDSGCLRVDREIIARDCDLTFVEYAVNDREQPAERRGRTREGLVRKLLAAGQDIVIVHTYCQDLYADMVEGRVPATVAEFEGLAEHYGLCSVWAGLHAFHEVRAGGMTWTEWLPDGLHPGPRGSWSYAAAVREFLGVEFSREPAQSVFSFPAPVHAGNWESASELPLSSVSVQGPWILRRVHGGNHVSQLLETHAPGARLAFDFVGRGLAFIFDYGKKSGEFLYRLDEVEWRPVVRERPEWCGDRGLVRALLISDELTPGYHRFEMVVTHGNRPECGGTECRLAQISVL